MNRTILILITLAFVSPSLCAQTRRRPSTPKPAKATVNLQAGLVYQATGPEMLARATFLLLDDDARKILQKAGIGPDDDKIIRDYEQVTANLPKEVPPQEAKKLMEAIRANPLEGYDLMIVLDPFLGGTPWENIQTALQPHVKASVTTDFNGAVQFEINPGR